jgi:hypothetical protein
MTSTALQRRQGRIVALMRASETRAIKNGIQGASDYLRAHPNTSTHFASQIRRELSRHLSDRDPFVTSWIYTLIATLGDEQYEPYLTSQLKSHEFDPVSRTWAVASLARVSGDYRQALQAINDEDLVAYQLSSAMFRYDADVGRAIRRASNNDDRLAHLWIALLFGEGRADIPVGQVKELTASRDAEVAQYSLFAMHKHPHTGAESVAFGPQDLAHLQPRVRRWFYQVLIKDPSNLERYASAILDWIANESDTQAREGLAKAFVYTRLPRTWIHELRSWAESEGDPFVLDALSQVRPLRDIVATRQSEEGGGYVHELDQAPSQRMDRGTVDPSGGTAFGSLQIRARSVSVTFVEKASYMDKRNQSVSIRGRGNVIGAVQGAYSEADTGNVTLQAGDAQVSALHLAELLRLISAELRKHDEAYTDAEMIEVVAQDLEEESSHEPPAEGKAQRLRTRFRQARLALGAITAVTSDVGELISQAQRVLHTVL